MEDSFRVRVEKIFGSLAPTLGTMPPSSSSSSSTSASLSSMWCLTDDEIEINAWNRDKDCTELDNKPRTEPSRSNGFLEHLTDEKKPADYREQMENDLDELEEGDLDGEGGDDGEEDEQRSRALSRRYGKPDDFNDEEWEIKSSIGSDCTLDFEEEEDAYDKVAVGQEKSGDRLYMKDVDDYRTEADDWNALPDSFRDINRDPRANLIAAKLRLKEDAETAKKMDSLRVSEKIDPMQVSENKNSVEASENETCLGVDPQPDSLEDWNVKSILKRKDSQANSKPQKRVRFSSECKDGSDEASVDVKDSSMGAFSAEEGNGSDDERRLQLYYPSGIPDYMRNPSKYIRYTFDSGEMDEESNRQAYRDFLSMLKRRKNSKENLREDAPIELPKSVPFVPKRKPGDATMVENITEPAQNQSDASKEMSRRQVITVSSAAVDETADEVCPMEEDEAGKNPGPRRGSGRSGRQYRTKAKSYIDD